MKKTYYILTAVILLAGCQHEADLTIEEDVSFSEIQGILSSNCTMSGCHGGQQPQSFSLESYEDVMDNGEIVPGSAWKSELYRVVANRQEPLMPPQGPLSDEDLRKIYLWIEQGAENN
jgi:hypothetical protein